MKLKSSLHRTAAVFAGAIIGLIGVAAVSGPASAHTAAVKGSTQCINGQNVVTWTLTNDWSDDTGAKVENLQLPAGGDATELTNDGTAGPKLQDGFILLPATRDGSSQVSFTQTVNKADSATITFSAVWKDYHSDGNTATVQLDQNCAPDTTPKCVDASQASFHHSFDVNPVGGTTIISLDDNVNLCEGVKVPVTSVSYYAPKPQFSTPQYEFDQDNGYLANDKDHRTLKLWVAIPPCYTQVDTFFGQPGDIINPITDSGKRYGDTKLGSPGKPGNMSKGPVAAYNGGSKSCATPASTSVPSCNGSQAIQLSNSGKFDEDFTVKYADQVKTVSVKAGQGATVDVPAGAGTVTVSAEGMADQTYNWTAPKDCALPTATLVNTCKDVTVTVTNPKDVTAAEATVTYGDQTKRLTVAAGSSEKATFAAGSATFATIKISGIDKEIKAALKKLNCGVASGGHHGNGSGGGGLPVTGSATSTIAAGAAVLLIAGGVFFFIARRRKVRFTA